MHRRMKEMGLTVAGDVEILDEDDKELEGQCRGVVQAGPVPPATSGAVLVNVVICCAAALVRPEQGLLVELGAHCRKWRRWKKI